MKQLSFKRKALVFALVLAAVLVAATAYAAQQEGDGNVFVNSFWSLVPPIVAIALALITKEVYSSLFAGVLVGALLMALLTLGGEALQISMSLPQSVSLLFQGLLLMFLLSADVLVNYRVVWRK